MKIESRQLTWCPAMDGTIPTPRWTLYDKVRLGIEMDSDVPLVHQERGFGSPIGYRPWPPQRTASQTLRRLRRPSALLFKSCENELCDRL